MGETQSKLHKENHFSQSRDSLSSTKEIVTSPQIEFYAKNVRELRDEIQNIDGIITDLKYESYQVTLTNYSKEIQNLHGTIKKKRAKVCDKILKDISECLKLLLDKKESSDFIKAQDDEERQNDVEVNINDDASEKESSIVTVPSPTPPLSTISSTISSTMATREYGRSKSLIQPKEQKTRQKRSRTKNLRFEEIVLEEMNEKVLRLRTDIDSTIELQLDGNFKEYETAIKDYYTELELISNPNNLPYVHNKKDELCKILIKYNNKLRKYKATKRNNNKSNNKGRDIDPHLLQEAYDIQNKLKDFEAIIDGDGNKETEHVREILNDYRTRVERMNDTSDEFRTIKGGILNKLTTLETTLDQKRHKLTEQIRQLVDLVDEFHGNVKDDSYLFLDQNLRRIWSRLSNENDDDLIEIIKDTLVTLNNKVQTPDVQVMDGPVFSKFNKDEINNLSNLIENDLIERDEDVVKRKETELNALINEEPRQRFDDEVHNEKQLLNQIIEYDNHWNQLYFNVKRSTITENILMALEKIFEGMYNNLEDLTNEYNNENLSDEEQKEAKEYALAIEKEIRKMLPGEVEKDNNTENGKEIDKDAVDEEDVIGNGTNVVAEVINEVPLGNVKEVHVEIVKPKKEDLPSCSKNETVEDNRRCTYTIETSLNVEDVFYEKEPRDNKQNLRRSYTFSDLQNIQKEVNNISKELFSDNIDPYDLKLRLDNQRSNLEHLEMSSNETLERTKEKILKNIDDTYLLVNDHFTYLKNVSDRNSLTELRKYEDAKLINEMSETLQTIETRIREFNGIERNDEYRSIESSLEEAYKKMTKLTCEESNRLMETIKRLNEELPSTLIRNQTKYVHKQSKEINELKRIIEEVQELRKHMNDLDPNYLTKQLNRCLKNIDAIDDKSNDKAQVAKVQIKQKILQYLKHLDDVIKKNDEATKEEVAQKEAAQTETVENDSTTTPSAHFNVNVNVNVENPVFLEKSKIIQVEAPQRINSTIYAEEQTTILENKELQSKRHPVHVVLLPLNHPENPYHQIEDVRHKLIEIKASMDCFHGNYKDDEYNAIADRIFRCNDHLNKIEVNGSKLIETSKSQYNDYVIKLLKYFEASVSGSDYFVCETNNVKDDLIKIEEKFVKLQERVASFDGTKSEYLLLNEELLAEKVNLEYMTIKDEHQEIGKDRKGNDLMELRENLLKIVLKLLKSLKCKSKRYSALTTNDDDANNMTMTTLNELISIRDELNRIESDINRFRGTKNDSNYTRLDESLINLVIQLDKLIINDDDDDSRGLKETKSQLILQLQSNLNLLHDKSTLPHFVKLRNSDLLLTTDV